VEVKDVMEDVAEVGRFTPPITFVPAGIGLSNIMLLTAADPTVLMTMLPTRELAVNLTAVKATVSI
jgi:hypothetical protein